MSRYVGPVWKISRRLGFSILETGKELSKRNYAPGQHGPDRRRKTTEYGKQLMEKQKSVSCMVLLNVNSVDYSL